MVRGEEGGVQPGGAAEKDREEGGEGRRTAADVVRARGRQHSVVVGVGGTGLANSDQYGFDGKVSDGGRQNREGVGIGGGEVGRQEGKGKGKEECGDTNGGVVGE